MRNIEHPGPDETYIEVRADEGKFLLQGYDMDTTEWFFEGTLEEVYQNIIDDWHYLKMGCGCAVLSNARGEVIRFDFW